MISRDSHLIVMMLLRGAGGKADREGAAALPGKPWKSQRKGGRKRGLGQGAVVNENSPLLIRYLTCRILTVLFQTQDAFIGTLFLLSERLDLLASWRNGDSGPLLTP